MSSFNVNVNAGQVETSNVAKDINITNNTTNKQQIDIDAVSKLIEVILANSKQLSVEAKTLSTEDLQKLSAIVKSGMEKAAAEPDMKNGGKQHIADTLEKVNKTMGGTATLLKNLFQLAALFGLG